jgi:hypothetical protein
MDSESSLIASSSGRHFNKGIIFHSIGVIDSRNSKFPFLNPAPEDFEIPPSGERGKVGYEMLVRLGTGGDLKFRPSDVIFNCHSIRGPL